MTTNSDQEGPNHADGNGRPPEEHLQLTTENCEEGLQLTPENCEEGLQLTPENCEEGLQLTPEKCEEGLQLTTENCEEGLQLTTENCEEGLQLTTENCEEGLQLTTENCEEGLQLTTENCEEGLKLTTENCVRVDVDEVWLYLGRFGRYQALSVLLMALSLWPQSSAVLSGVFVGMAVNQTCHSSAAAALRMSSFPNGSEAVLTECSVQVVANSSSGPHILHEEDCLKFEYSSEVKTSFLAEWDLVCAGETLGQLPQMLSMLGMMVGAITLPPIGDTFGRRTLALSSQVCHLMVSLGLAYAPTFELFLILKFLSGAFNQGFMVTQYIMLMELLPTEDRTLTGLVGTSLWVLSVLSLVPVAYTFLGYSWRTLQLAYGLTSLACVFLLFMDESLRWLLANRRAKRAERVMRKACALNGKSYQGLLKAVLRDDRMALNGKGFTRCLKLMVNSLTYYGITLLSTSLAGDPYINFLIGALLEVPSAICMFYLLTRFGRKTVAIGFTGAAGVSLLAAVIVATLTAGSHSLSLVQTGLTLFGKFCISASFNTMWLYTPELYPTNLRNLGTGLSSMSARLAASASPFFTILAGHALWAPGALFSAACFLCVFLLSFLPETKFRELPATIAEIENWYTADRQRKHAGSSPKDVSKSNKVI
ncbi:hypothetical protein EGW08_008455 [Elysia chlorotica]|uniref:Major facilitator superfamily (MFS) profile domain-containing protein n=1 Tax=Elysia chlorotica TaxID=188477 RepID=A0A3S1BH32_ELYCH|nr:hypothetical protein EGW08_008455 [Elysia chlorotica]